MKHDALIYLIMVLSIAKLMRLELVEFLAASRQKVILL